MRKTLLASTCLAAMVAAPSYAETTINSATTTPVKTSTVKSGAPDDIKITKDGSIKPAGGTAVTIDSNNKVVNEGTIQIGNANGATGIFAEAGVTGSITNSATGKIVIDESYEGEDIDKDGDKDGPFAVGNGRTGIGTGGAFAGNIANEGAITVEGNDSAGIRLGGPLTGKFTNNGTVSVLGDNALGIGLQDVTGDVRIAGKVAAIGENAMAAQITGDIGGALEIQGELTASGYRFITAPSDPSKLDADDLLQGGPALSIEGDVSGGVILAVAPKDADKDDKDEDDDGIDDDKEGAAAVRSFGEAPAMRIGSANRDVTIGAVAGTGTDFGLIINGTVVGNGLYAGKDATGLQIGGLGGAVDISGGVKVGGSVNAISKDASATAIRIGAGATVPEIRVSGKVEAKTGGENAADVATAILVESGSHVATIRNSGTINAEVGGKAATARAIVDLSGNVDLVENSGAISAKGAEEDGENIAIDLAANAGGATVKQVAVASGVTAPSITGDVRFGGGDDVFDIADGTVTGNTGFGAGDDQMKLSGDAAYTGDVAFGAGNDSLAMEGSSRFVGLADFGGGADSLTIGGSAVFSGTLANSAGLAVAVNGGAFDVGGAATISSLSVTDEGILAVTLDGGDGGTALTVTGNASFAEDSKLALKLSSLDEAEGEHIVVTAGSLTGADNLTTETTLLPYLFKGELTATGTQLIVDVERKSVDELELNRSEAGAFNAVIDALAADEDIEGVFLDITDRDTFRARMQQMLPEHEGGVFETVTTGSRALARYLQDPNAPYQDEGKWGYWVNQAVWGTSKSLGDTASYDVSGWGISGGAEIKTDVGSFGGSIAYLYGKDGNGLNDNQVTTSQFEGSLHWRLRSDGWMANARISGAPIKMKGTRVFRAEAGAEDIDKTMRGKWDGTLYSASGSVAHDGRLGGLTLRPTVAVDYYKLKEDGYTETGGGDALDLTVGARDSDELAVTGTVALGLEFGGADEYDGWTRFELEGGRRQIVGGSLGATVASFKDGDPFTLVPAERTSGWVGRLRGIAGNSAFQVGGEISAEEQQNHVGWAFRASLKVGL
ncbi:autotransporter outer membrane beta-barrel domain-containing protein [Sphingopyxis indica]|uniref:autotransporter outer membrane beta-barrel domain-containing protein n=1 Tax=Sphingopyxis indica TaxID=436663 RepID=UPI002939239D|nr:autotransporter outer membrane beta-barrel domain-containing protein [Sphingopyxis indica]WOF41764.1 autotransporter outer membrane beta-barrel domain-containing protein [Sphingopyxis indica]